MYDFCSQAILDIKIKLYGNLLENIINMSKISANHKNLP